MYRASTSRPSNARAETEFFIDNLLVRIHFIIVMIRWTGLAPWEYALPFLGSPTSTFLAQGVAALMGAMTPMLATIARFYLTIQSTLKRSTGRHNQPSNALPVDTVNPQMLAQGVAALLGAMTPLLVSIARCYLTNSLLLYYSQA